MRDNLLHVVLWMISCWSSIPSPGDQVVKIAETIVLWCRSLTYFVRTLLLTMVKVLWVGRVLNNCRRRAVGTANGIPLFRIVMGMIPHASGA